MSTESNKRLVFSILQFLSTSCKDGSIKSDDIEGIEIASQCISEAFSVNLEDEQDKKNFDITPETISNLLQSHFVTRTVKPVTKVGELTTEEKVQAEKAKSSGNQKMAQKDYPGAIVAYSDAIKIDSNNPVYYSNRAAAHSQVQDHSSAIADAKSAIEIDSNFSKAYSRLGHALFSSGEYAEAVTAYEQGLEIDPSNATMKASLATAKSRVPSEEESDNEAVAVAGGARGAPAAGAGGAFPGMPAGLASMMAGMGGAGGPGGMDFGAMMQNPAIMQMAQQMMSGGGMEQMMNNPMIQQMMAGMQNGGGMPDMATLMNDPMLRNLAQSMNGMGGGPAEGDDGEDGPANMYS